MRTVNDMDFQEFKSQYEHQPVKEKLNQAPDKPVVSVLVMTYNQVDYIKDCLKGILMQKTDFAFEILLGDDDSTDGTREICDTYANKYPDKIRLFLHHRANNIHAYGQPTSKFNALYNFFAAKGKYIALCEGDDYWIDPLKLQKQVDFLEKNEDCSLCYHSSKITYVNNSQQDSIFKPKETMGSNKFDLRQLIKSNNDLGIRTASMVFRSETIHEISYFILNTPIDDLSLRYLCGYHGNLGYIGGDPMCLHRKFALGSWSSGMHSYESQIRFMYGRIDTHNLFNEYSDYQYDKEFKELNRLWKKKCLAQASKYGGRLEIAQLAINHISFLIDIRHKSNIGIWIRLIFGDKIFSIINNFYRAKLTKN